MTVEERRRVRDKYRAWQRLPDSRRSELLSRFEAFQVSAHWAES